MGLFEKIFKPNKTELSKEAIQNAEGYFKTLTAYRPVFRTWNGEIYESELVRAAIDARARHISKLSIEIYGSAKPALRTKLKQGPNQFQTWSQFLYRVSTILDITNTAIVVPVFDELMAVTGYYPVIPRECSIIEYKGEPWLKFKFGNGKIAAVELKMCAVLTRHQYKNDFFGSSNNALDETVKLIDIQNQGIEEAAKNSATYRFMAQLSNFARSEDVKKERLRFSEENLTAESEAGGLLLFPNTYGNVKELTPRSYAVDAEQRRLIQENVYNYFGVNEDVIQNKAFGDAWSAFYEGAVEPFAVQFSECMAKAIFSERERAQGSGVMATANRLQYMSNADKLSVTAQLTDRGIFSINEAREVFNLAPVDGGDVRTIRGEYKNADEIGGNENNE